MALFIAVFPASIRMALGADGTAGRVIGYGRPPFQILLVLWELAVYRRARLAGEIPPPPR